MAGLHAVGYLAAPAFFQLGMLASNIGLQDLKRDRRLQKSLLSAQIRSGLEELDDPTSLDQFYHVLL